MLRQCRKSRWHSYECLENGGEFPESKDGKIDPQWVNAGRMKEDRVESFRNSGDGGEIQDCKSVCVKNIIIVYN